MAIDNAELSQPQQDAESTPTPDAGDKGPLEGMDIDPAENGAYIVTHRPKASPRVKAANFDAMKPKKHVVKDHEALVEHVRKHGKRVKA